MLTLVCCAHKHNSEQNTYIYENVIPSFSTVGIRVVQEEFLEKYKSMKHSVYRSFDLYIVKNIKLLHCTDMCVHPLWNHVCLQSAFEKAQEEEAALCSPGFLTLNWDAP